MNTQTILQFYLHPQTGRCVSQLRHQTVWRDLYHYIQCVPMNTAIPIFKIHKIQQFVTIWEKSLFEISKSHEQNHFITKAHDWRNRLMQKWKQFLHGSGRFGSNCQNLPHHSMRTFENGGACIHRCLLWANYWIMLKQLVDWFTDIFAYLILQTEFGNAYDSEEYW